MIATSRRLALVALLCMAAAAPAAAQATIGWNRGPWAAAGRVPDSNSYGASGYVLLASAAASSSDGMSVTTPAITTTGATTIVVHVGWFDNGSATVALVDSKGNTCTGLTSHILTSIVASQFFVCYGPTVGAGHTFTATVPFPSITVLAFSGPSSSTDQQAGSTTVAQPFEAATTIQPGSVTPIHANELIVVGLANEDNSGGAISVDSGFSAVIATYTNGASEGSAIAYKVQTAATAENPTWSVTNQTYLASSSVTITP